MSVKSHHKRHVKRCSLVVCGKKEGERERKRRRQKKEHIFWSWPFPKDFPQSSSGQRVRCVCFCVYMAYSRMNHAMQRLHDSSENMQLKCICAHLQLCYMKRRPYKYDKHACLELVCGQACAHAWNKVLRQSSLVSPFAAGPRLVISCSRTVSAAERQPPWEKLRVSVKWDTKMPFNSCVCVCVYQSDAVTVGVRHCSCQPTALHVTHTHTHFPFRGKSHWQTDGDETEMYCIYSFTILPLLDKSNVSGKQQEERGWLGLGYHSDSHSAYQSVDFESSFQFMSCYLSTKRNSDLYEAIKQNEAPLLSPDFWQP